MSSVQKQWACTAEQQIEEGIDKETGQYGHYCICNCMPRGPVDLQKVCKYYWLFSPWKYTSLKNMSPVSHFCHFVLAYFTVLGFWPDDSMPFTSLQFLYYFTFKFHVRISPPSHSSNLLIPILGGINTKCTICVTLMAVDEQEIYLQGYVCTCSCIVCLDFATTETMVYASECYSEVSQFHSLFFVGRW
jgi:hypothetical protein